MSVEETPVEDLLREYLFGACGVEEFAHGLREVDAPERESLLLAGVRNCLDKFEQGEATRSEMDTALIRLLQAVHASSEGQGDSES